ncbi:MAG TPA: alpha/beta hydrolase [Candidatus Avipropionibacterium avicola]|uniref:Alpha/beta hydrolase n=1 Tax=Candidatus Avipropionibacterium avicola TaxID=2840701 RepID=A0A9D1KMC1_9ACTN|nr:alpha/beta hydrolase [Candidatus Avipropionibacterium avicola]
MRTLAHPDRQVETQSIDLYDPAAGTPEGHGRLAMLFVHGGGWYAGERSAFDEWAERAAAQGHPAGSTGYRVDEESTYRDKVADVIAGWRLLAEQFPDAESVCLVGSSAGAHLVTALALADPDLVPALPVSAVVSFNGPGSLRRETLYKDATWQRVDQLAMTPEEFDLLDGEVTVRPLEWAFVNAEDETSFPHEHVAALAARLEAAGHHTETTVVPDTKHGFCYKVLSRGGEPARVSAEAVDRFWNRLR